MPKVVIYTTPYCPYCRMALRLLDEKSVAYENIDVSGQWEKRKWLAEASGQRTVPQVFIDDKPYGGYSDILALDQKGKLDPVLGLA